MRHVFGALNSDRIEIKFYGPFPATIKDICSRFFNHHSSIADISVNGRPASMNEIINKPVFLEIFFGEELKSFQKPVIIWQNGDLAVVFKPPLVSTQPTRFSGEPHLKGFLESIYGPSVHIPSRLDFGVSGLILISLNSKTHKFVHRLYERKLIGKYYCFKSNHLAPWIYRYVETDIAINAQHPATRMVVRGSGAQSLFINLRISSDDGWIYLVKIFSGKTHQIRLHAKYLDIPIVGDQFYNPSNSFAHIHLCCFCLSFEYNSHTFTFTIPPTLAPSWLDVEQIMKLKDRWLF